MPGVEFEDPKTSDGHDACLVSTLHTTTRATCVVKEHEICYGIIRRAGGEEGEVVAF
jgi:hypothetical protein